jgi:predicted metal-binding membrane protein
VTTENGTALERSLKRDRLIVAVGLSVVVLIAAIYTVLGIGMPMSAISMTQMAIEMPGMMMASAQWTPGYTLMVFLMWWVMMVAMMVPSAAPTVLFYAALVRKKKKADKLYAAVSVFLTGYLLVWGLFSLVATALQWTLVSIGEMSGMMEITRAPVAGALLVVAGLYQVSPIKQACLRHCQHPVFFFMHNWKPGVLGGLRMGMQNGWFCLGCCWVLMALLFVGGVMNLLWIAALAVFVGLEKLSAGLPWLSKLSSLTLIAGGVLLALG